MLLAGNNDTADLPVESHELPVDCFQCLVLGGSDAGLDFIGSVETVRWDGSIGRHASVGVLLKSLHLLHFVSSKAELSHDFIGDIGWFGQIVATVDAVVLGPGDIERNFAFGDLVSDKGGKAGCPCLSWACWCADHSPRRIGGCPCPSCRSQERTR